MSRVQLKFLGQSGIRFQLGNTTVYADPYLTNSVEETFGRDLRRMCPPPMRPNDITDADVVLLTHEHLDHFDPLTLEPLAVASPHAQFVCPRCLVARLRDLGVEDDRIIVADEDWIAIGPDIRIHPVPAAHPEIERDSEGGWCAVGFVLDYCERRIYYAGDTSPDAEIFASVSRLGPIDVAFLPVNERNYFRDRAGIIGNMSVREAFLVASELGVRLLVPIHWDLFRVNGAFPEEMQLLYDRLAPSFQMLLQPAEI